MAVEDLLTRKQENVLKNLNSRDWFITILHGAKRSGKTFVNNLQFLIEIKRVREIADSLNIATPQYILAGYSMSNIQDNILTELSNTLGLTFKFDRFNSFEIFGVKIIQTTHGSIQGVGRIRGMTAFGAYVNEASLAKEEVFEEIKSRCSGQGARILADTNPEHPEHWLKKNYINSPDEAILNYHFELDDNTFLEERYIRNIKAATPSGMFYDRSIKGLWVSADGVVYPDFNREKHVIDMNQLDYNLIEEVIAGVDWGYEHLGSIVVLARVKETWYLIEEHTAKHKEIEYWVDIARAIVSRHGAIEFYCDSARPEHVGRFIREGFNARNARKAVIAGIEQVSRLIKQDKFKIVQPYYSTGEPVELQILKELYSYVWNEKTGNPEKLNDDVLDSVRYAIYSHTYKSVSFNHIKLN